jgi:hypothetical protein
MYEIGLLKFWTGRWAGGQLMGGLCITSRHAVVVWVIQGPTTALLAWRFQLKPTRLSVLKQAKLHNMVRRVMMNVDCFESLEQSS